MFATDLAPHTQLRALEVWQAAEFAEHLDRAREHIKPWVGPAFVTTTVDEARATLQRYASDAATDGARLYGIWLAGELAGGVMFTHFNATSGVCELGCWLEPHAEGRGLVTRACRLLLAWAFDVRGLHRAEWRCRVGNTRSSQVAQRLNMRLEGVLRQSWPVAGVYHDKQVWAILAPEWRASTAETVDPTTSNSTPAGRS